MTPTQATSIIDVTERTFDREVLERSHTLPVIVDFWAIWCGPCRLLGPILEKVTVEYEGDFVLAKVNVDDDPYLAQQYGVQGIPSVKAFRYGRVVSEFTGALPEPRVRQFFKALRPSLAEEQTTQARQHEAAGQLGPAADAYRAALAQQADYYPAMLGLGRVLLRQGELEEGLARLKQIPLGAPEKAPAEAIIATVQFQQEAAGYNEPELRAQIVAAPNDVSVRYALASLLVTQERFIEAMEEFLEVVRRNRQYKEDGARKALLALFTLLGPEEPLVREYQKKLANALF
jgi:putative thioredoxin